MCHGILLTAEHFYPHASIDGDLEVAAAAADSNPDVSIGFVGVAVFGGAPSGFNEALEACFVLLGSAFTVDGFFFEAKLSGADASGLDCVRPVLMLQDVNVANVLLATILAEVIGNPSIFATQILPFSIREAGCLG